MARVAAPHGCGVVQHVDRIVVAQHSTTLNIHVGDRPDLVQHVLIEQIADPALVHAGHSVLPYFLAQILLTLLSSLHPRIRSALLLSVLQPNESLAGTECLAGYKAL